MSIGNGQDKSLQEQAEFWKTTLWDAPELTAIQTDYPRQAVLDRKEGIVTFGFDKALKNGLAELDRCHEIAQHMTLLAAWAALLARLSNQDDVVVGMSMPVPARSDEAEAGESPVDEFAVRLDLSGQPTVAELLDRARACVLDARKNADIRFDQVLELTGLTPTPSHHPLFQTALVSAHGDEAFHGHQGARCDLIL